MSRSEKAIFTNLCMIYDGAGNILGETGLIRPGEYVRSVNLTALPQPDAEVSYKIMSYEPDTYFSCGAVIVHCQTKPE